MRQRMLPRLDLASRAHYEGRSLLDRVRAGDEEAFTLLVRLHGPMVLGVSRRVLRCTQDAEDAFQAVFLVLAQKIAKLRADTNLANWLYGVALRTAWAARRSRLRREKKERRASGRELGDARQADAVAGILDRELAALPVIYRAPILLCVLEGRSRQDAARELGCCPGTLSGRLSRAKRLLARRLARHGLPAAALGATSS